MKRLKFMLITIFALVSQVIFSQDSTSKINSGDTSWMLISTALVMFMTAPALSLFYGGLVKRKNVLNILMQCFITLAVVSLLWIICGYTLSFSPKGLIPGFIGNFDFAMFKNMGLGASDVYAVTIPHILFAIYQGMFAVITPALIIGAFAERMKFSSFLIFVIAWSIFVYFPVAHWIWSTDGWLFKLGVIDFAGGIVVHINAGIASLVAAVLIGKRKYLKPTPPHNLTFTMFGAAMLWFGWFGFNAGSALAANGLAANAFVVTNTAAAAAVVIWFILDIIIVKKPTMLGSATGAIAGLAAITPAAGFVDVGAAIVIGSLSSLICYFMV
ncbi:MAG TPA: ammonium transporter, partial [Spirochaetota bacterium]|nr:ammonium transporter [Spirochaetota bacterium]